MLETMLALKNNDMRKIPGYDPEPVERLRKLQRTLVGGDETGLTSVNLLPGWQGCLQTLFLTFLKNINKTLIFINTDCWYEMDG